MRFKFQHMQYCNYNALLLSLLNGIVKFKGVAELHSWSWVFLILNEIIFRLCTTFLVFSVWTPCSRLETRVCCASITGRRGKQKSQWMPLDSRSQEQRSAVRKDIEGKYNSVCSVDFTTWFAELWLKSMSDELNSHGLHCWHITESLDHLLFTWHYS